MSGKEEMWFTDESRCRCPYCLARVRMTAIRPQKTHKWTCSEECCNDSWWISNAVDVRIPEGVLWVVKGEVVSYFVPWRGQVAGSGCWVCSICFGHIGCDYDHDVKCHGCGVVFNSDDKVDIDVPNGVLWVSGGREVDL